ncbi:MAG: GerAB/ArcD/ProY family transporter [Clostridiales bacterium]|nr:GerAB/ArcD/ProY family transporter [Clostridiales bacterium]
MAATMILACIYASCLGVEAVSRFGSMVFIIIIIGFAALVILGYDNFSYLNLFPLIQNTAGSFAKNSAFSLVSSNELVLLLALAPKINGKAIKPFCFSMLFSYLVTIALIIFTIGVLGDTATLSAYPVFEVSQIAKYGEGERLDAVFTAVWIFAIFIKTTLYLYAAVYCLSGKNV